MSTGNPSVVDFVGYGKDATCSETSPTPLLDNTTAAIRNWSGCQDTSNNLLNFTVSTPIPRNSSYPINSCSGPSGVGTANPVVLAAGSDLLLTVAVQPGNPPNPISAVTGDLRAIGGVANQPFHDDGNNIFSFATTVSANTPASSYRLPITITDGGGGSGFGLHCGQRERGHQHRLSPQPAGPHELRAH